MRINSGWGSGLVAMMAGATAMACSVTYGEAPAADVAPQEEAPAAPPPEPDAKPVPDTEVGAGELAPVSTCDAAKPFGSPHRLGGLDGSARFSSDELRAYTSNGLTFGVARRRSVADAFAALEPFGFPVQLHATDAPTASGDERTLVFTDYSSHRLLLATRDDAGEAFLPALVLDGGINAPAWGQIDPYLVADGSALYFHRYPLTSETFEGDIFVAARKQDGFADAVPVEGINTFAEELSPVVTPDGLTIFWASDRTDLYGKGMLDIYVATRTSKDAAFTNVRNVAELNADGDERPTWISPDACRLYFLKDDAVLVASR
ncbi:MAG: PD40 domain-containing protein [Labilithrix sp.]|nr:PD40 domain-containing protein [Labilithrix sp.]MCW5812085.1 PD40 domain-containing protein [Labilithrix sp.]